MGWRSAHLWLLSSPQWLQNLPNRDKVPEIESVILYRGCLSLIPDSSTISNKTWETRKPKY
ncbi:hypothetical protein NIES39_D00250 [Arthrospira platensis NIES-39]|nr:hypothetical protein NIES39_D00250 [Arthrospira platensis NIES-39]